MNRTRFLVALLMLTISSICRGVDLSGISDSNGMYSIHIDPAITEDESVAASVATNTAASTIVRLSAIETLEKNPSPYVAALLMAGDDPDFSIRFAATKALLECDPIASARIAKAIIQELSTTQPASQGSFLLGMSVAALLAKLDDSSGFDFVAHRLEHAHFSAEKLMALTYLPDFQTIMKAPAMEAILAFIETTLPALDQPETTAKHDAEILLPIAFHALVRLQAIESIPRLKAIFPLLNDHLLQILQQYILQLEALSPTTAAWPSRHRHSDAA